MASRRMKFYDWIAIIVMIIGGLNWGLDLIGFSVFQYMPAWLGGIIKAAVFLATVYSIVALWKLASKY